MLPKPGALAEKGCYDSRFLGSGANLFELDVGRRGSAMRTECSKENGLGSWTE